MEMYRTGHIEHSDQLKSLYKKTYGLLNLFYLNSLFIIWMHYQFVNYYPRLFGLRFHGAM